MDILFKKGVPNEMIYGFAGATLVLGTLLVLALKFMEQTLRTGTGIILGAGVMVCGYLTYMACRKRIEVLRNKSSWRKRRK